MNMRRTILLVDDDEQMRAMTALFLSSAGYDVHCEHDGQEGLAYWLAHRDDIIFIVTDYRMPKMYGHEMLQEIMRIKPSIGALILSADSQKELEKVNLPVRILRKPFSNKQLVGMIAEQLCQANA